MQEINLQELETIATNSFSQFIQTLSSADENYFNIVPFENSWTAGQVGEHVFKFQSGIVNVSKSETIKPGRAFDEYAAFIKNMFLNFELKMNSPEFVQPGNEPVDKNSLIRNLENTAEKILHLIKTVDLKLLCKGFEFPTIGELTRYELVCFGIYHTQRHTHQLENIIAHLSQ